MITIKIDGPPIAKERHRAYVTGSVIRMFDPQDKVKKKVRASMFQQLGDTPQVSGMVAIDFVFTMPIAVSHSKKHRQQLLDDQYATGKPDIDNLIKFYMDAANTVLWQDDNCVCKVSAIKVYGESTGTLMSVTTIKGQYDNQ